MTASRVVPSDVELGVAAAHIASALSGVEVAQDPETMALQQEAARRTHPCLSAAAAGPKTKQVVTESLAVENGQFFLEAYRVYDSGTTSESLYRWSDGVMFSFQQVTRPSSGDSESESGGKARQRTINIDPAPDHRQFRKGSLQVFGAAAESARIIGKLLGVDAEAVLHQEGEGALPRWSGVVRGGSDEWAQLKSQLFASQVQPFNGGFVDKGGVLKCELDAVASELTWREEWFDSAGCLIESAEITWSRGIPTSYERRHYLIGSDVVFYSVQAALTEDVALEGQPFPEWKFLPGDLVYDNRKSPTVLRVVPVKPTED